MKNVILKKNVNTVNITRKKKDEILARHKHFFGTKKYNNSNNIFRCIQKEEEIHFFSVRLKIV